MARPARPSPYVCNLCGAEMPFRAIGEHKRTAHADILEQQHQAGAMVMRKIAPILVIAGVGLFLALFVPSVILHVPVPDWYIVVVLVIWFLSNLAPFRYATKVRKENIASFGGIPYDCRVCDAKMPKQDMRSHLMSEHPSEFRYLRVFAFVVVGSILGLAVTFLAGVLRVMGFLGSVPPDVLLIWFWAALFAWMGLISAWGIVGDPRHKVKARVAWQATHINEKVPGRNG